jgi:hypothetical protein
MKPPVSGGFFHGRFDPRRNGRCGHAATLENNNKTRANEHLRKNSAKNLV